MSVFEKYNIKFLNLKSREHAEIKIFFIKNKSLDGKNQIRSLLSLKDLKETDKVGYKINLHYIGEKKKGRPHLVRCNSPEQCLPCSVYHKNSKQALRPFSKMFFYGIFEKEIVCFSLNLNAGFKAMKEIENFEGCNPLNLDNNVVCLFDNVDSPSFATILFNKVKRSPNLKISGEIIERLKDLPDLETLLDEKYPETLDENETKIIMKK